MLEIVKKLFVGALLLTVASLILLSSDNSNHSRRPKSKKIAICQFASMPLIDDGVAGLIEGLERAGFVENRNLDVDFFNAQNDFASMNAIASQMVNGKYDLLLTVTTPCLQAVAKANEKHQTDQIFCMVTDPFSAGVGITGKAKEDHPDYLTGIGTFDPVRDLFSYAQQIFPDMKRVGVVWSPSDASSVSMIKVAREAAKEFGFTLLEKNIDQTNLLSDALKSLFAQGIDGYYLMTDNLVTTGVDTVMSLNLQQQIPVFSTDYGFIEHGAALTLGPDFHEVGVLTGKMAASVLKGDSTCADIPVADLVPTQLGLNIDRMREIGVKWVVSDDLCNEATVVHDKTGEHEKAAVSEDVNVLSGNYKIGFCYFGPDPVNYAVVAGVKACLKDNGLIEGENVEYIEKHANGDMSMVTPLVTSIDNSDVDVVFPVSTPCVTAASNVVKNHPVVFSGCYDPLAAGAGRSFDDHLPFLTGIASFPPLEMMVDFIKRLYPDIKKVGTLYSPAEANSVSAVKRGTKAFQSQGIELIAKTVSTTNEVNDAVQALLSEQPEVLWISGDNTVLQAFATVVQRSQKLGVPIIVNEAEFLEGGALLSCGVQFFDSGYAGGKLLLRVLKGENTADIPIQEVAVPNLGINLKAALDNNVELPPAFLREAAIVKGLGAVSNSPRRIAIVTIADSLSLESARQGVLDVFADSGLKADIDYTIDDYNAHGEIANLSLIMKQVEEDAYDLLITIGTPSMISAVQNVKSLPIVFTVASNPEKVGLFKKSEQPANITGVHDDPPIGLVIDLAAKYEEKVESIGVIWNPAERNSEISVEKLRAECSKRNIKLNEITASSVNEFPNLTQTLVSKDVDIIILSADNLVNTGFPLIAREADKADVPVYTTEPDMVKRGAKGAIGDSYYDWGRQSGQMAVSVMAGLQPGKIPIAETSVKRTVMRDRSVSPVLEKKRILVAGYNEAETLNEVIQGFRDGLQKNEMVEGVDFELIIKNAQGDIAALNTIMELHESLDVDLVVPFSTPALQSAVNQIKDTHIVFGYVSDPVLAGAGESYENHLPNITGVDASPVYSVTADVLSKAMPQAKQGGVIFCPSEVNSVLAKDILVEEMGKKGIKIDAYGVDTPNQVSDAALAMCSKRPDFICINPDNMSHATFAMIISAANKYDIPVIGCASVQAENGAVLTVAKDYYAQGLLVADYAVRVLNGENPKDIPFLKMEEPRLYINQELAEKYNMLVPENCEIIKKRKAA